MARCSGWSGGMTWTVSRQVLYQLDREEDDFSWRMRWRDYCSIYSERSWPGAVVLAALTAEEARYAESQLSFPLHVVASSPGVPGALLILHRHHHRWRKDPAPGVAS